MTFEIEGQQDEPKPTMSELAAEAEVFFVRVEELFRPIEAVGFILRNEPIDNRPWAEIHIDKSDGSHVRRASTSSGRKDGFQEVYQQVIGKRADQHAWVPDPVEAANELMDALLPDLRELTGKESPRYELWVRHVPVWADGRPYSVRIAVHELRPCYRNSGGSEGISATISAASAQRAMLGAMQDVLGYAERRVPRQVVSEVA